MGLTYTDELKQANPADLWAAVGGVYERYESEGKKPGSGKYEWDTTYHRREIIDDVTREFCLATGCDQHMFPFRDDYVAFALMKYRKASADVRRIMRAEC